MKNDTFDLLGTTPQPATASYVQVIKDLRSFLNLAVEIREKQKEVEEKQSILVKEIDRLTNVTENIEMEPLADDRFPALLPENFSNIEAFSTLADIYERVKASAAKMALLTLNEIGEYHWVIWRNSSLIPDSLCLQILTYSETTKQWQRVSTEIKGVPNLSVDEDLLSVFLVEPKPENVEAQSLDISDQQIIKIKQSSLSSDVIQHTMLNHRAIRLVPSDTTLVEEMKIGITPIKLVFMLVKPDPNRLQDVLDKILADPLAAFGVTL